MKLSFRKILIFGITVLIVSFVVFKIFSINRAVQKTLAEENASRIEQSKIPFEKKLLIPHLSKNVQILQNTRAARSLVKFQDSYFAATGGGLLQLSEDGKTLRHFTVLNGLPESDLTALTVYQNRLFIGTRENNLVAFDGEKFENYVWTDRKSNAVTAFLEDKGRLLIGTFDGGLIEFDGDFFAEIKAEKERIAAINCLFKDDAKLYVGTFNNGLWIYENDNWTHFTVNEGLPSNRVVGIAVKDKNLFVATDFGLAVRQEKNFRALVVMPSLSSLAIHDNRIFLTKDNGEIFTFEDSLQEFSDEKSLREAHLISLNENLFLLSKQGVSQIVGAKERAFLQTENASLTDNFVSALALDKNANLWVGTFRDGIDVFSSEGRKIKHLESESVREINFLQADAETVSAATTGGLIRFKNDFTTENLTKKDGLPTSIISHFSGAFLATTKGLAFKDKDKFRVISAVQGLPNNSAYTTLQIGKKLYVGTLGGLAEIEENQVVRAFKDSNSNLKTNWVTALVFANERLFIGTYGGGIFELLPSGEIRAFEGETGKFVVNPNALASDGERLYAGTLEGLKVLNLRTQEWKTVRKILPAKTVMSIAIDAENVYVGTTNGIAKIQKSYFAKGENE